MIKGTSVSLIITFCLIGFCFDFFIKSIFSKLMLITKNFIGLDLTKPYQIRTNFFLFLFIYLFTFIFYFMLFIFSRACLFRTFIKEIFSSLEMVYMNVVTPSFRVWNY